MTTRSKKFIAAAALLAAQWHRSHNAALGASIHRRAQCCLTMHMRLFTYWRAPL